MGKLVVAKLYPALRRRSFAQGGAVIVISTKPTPSQHGLKGQTAADRWGFLPVRLFLKQTAWLLKLKGCILGVM
jgi:hypothetical protein